MRRNGGELDYLRAMADLMERGQPITNGAIARALEVSPPSVTEMVGRLRDRNLVEHEGRGEIRLTREGRRVACGGVRRHRLIETWLVHSLSMDWAIAHEEAHLLEHALSARMEAALAEHLRNPRRDPHGALIPDTDEDLIGDELRSLAGLDVGESGAVARMSDRDADKLAYWRSLGLSLGSMVEIAGVAPYGGPVEIVVDGEQVQVGRAALDGIWLHKTEPEREGV